MGDARVGIVGFGRIGAEHAGWLGQCKTIRAVAAADVTPARREMAIARGLKGVENLSELLEEPGIDAILIASPTAMHFEQASAALAAGKHVMVEKPMTTGLADARRLVELAERHQRVLSVFQNRRWDADYLAVKAAVASGVFGKVINVESRLGQFASCVGPAAREYRPQWRNEAAFGGGGLFDWGSHFLDQIWQLMLPARAVRVFAQLRGNVWTSDCDDFARVCIDFDRGAVAMVEINTTTTRPGPRWHIDGVAGSAESPSDPGFDVKNWARLEFAGSDGRKRILPAAEDGLSEVEIWERFGEAVAGSGEPAVDARSVLPTMQLLDAARRSSRDGVAVELAAL